MRNDTTVPVGTRVRVTRPFRSPVTVSGPRAFGDWIDWPEGATGLVINVTNAGFRGIEHQVRIDGPVAPSVLASGVSADDLEVL